jgi:hypothetical protein
MTHQHHHSHRSHASAATPTFSLLRMSALERLAASGVVLAGLWLLVYAVLA